MSALSQLREVEKSAVLDEIVADEASIRELAEAAARRRLAHVDEAAVAEEILDRVGSIPHDELAAHTGRTRYGYVQPTDAAWEILEREIEPWLDDLRRRVAVGLPDSVRRLAIGIIDGLHRLEPVTTRETRLLSWAPDFPREATEQVLSTLSELGVEAPLEELERVAPGWV